MASSNVLMGAAMPSFINHKYCDKVIAHWLTMNKLSSTLLFQTESAKLSMLRDPMAQIALAKKTSRHQRKRKSKRSNANRYRHQNHNLIPIAIATAKSKWKKSSKEKMKMMIHPLSIYRTLSSQF